MQFFQDCWSWMLFAGGQGDAYQAGAQLVLAVAAMRFSAGFCAFPMSVSLCK